MQRTKEDLAQTIAARRMVWEQAREMADPIVEKHGVQPYPVGGNIFAPGSKQTEVDQHISSVIEVAEWLLEPLT